MSTSSNTAKPGRANWTTSPAAATKHLRGLSIPDRARLLCTFHRMSLGEDGGQIEPWGPPVRAVLYPEWSNDDFKQVTEAFAFRTRA